MKVEFYLSIGLAGADRTDIVELPDSYSDEDIEDEYQEWKGGYMDTCWNKLESIKNKDV